jgi:hypothetical protein
MTNLRMKIAGARTVLARHALMLGRAVLHLVAAGGELLAFLLPDLLALGGAAAMAYGASLYSLPLGYIVGGVLALGLGLMGIRARAGGDGKAAE